MTEKVWTVTVLCLSTKISRPNSPKCSHLSQLYGHLYRTAGPCSPQAQDLHSHAKGSLPPGVAIYSVFQPAPVRLAWSPRGSSVTIGPNPCPLPGTQNTCPTPLSGPVWDSHLSSPIQGTHVPLLYLNTRSSPREIEYFVGLPAI